MPQRKQKASKSKKATESAAEPQKKPKTVARRGKGKAASAQKPVAEEPTPKSSTAQRSAAKSSKAPKESPAPSAAAKSKKGQPERCCRGCAIGTAHYPAAAGAVLG
jgi:hypothetical protein